MKLSQNNTGFTMAGLIITVLVITVLSVATFFWLDPLERIGTAKDERRRGDVNLISRAIADYVTDNKGALPVLGAVTTDKKTLCEEQGGSNISCGGDSQLCIRIADPDFYSDYLGKLPIGPDKSVNTDTGYYLQKDSDGKLVVGACSSYGSSAITAKSGVKVTCAAYAGGYCWYLGGDQQNCNTSCDSIGLTCVEGAAYSADVNSGDSCYGALNRNFFSADCYDCDNAGNGEPPHVSDDGSECYILATSVDCSVAPTGQGYFPICPCE